MSQEVIKITILALSYLLKIHCFYKDLPGQKINNVPMVTFGPIIFNYSNVCNVVTQGLADLFLFGRNLFSCIKLLSRYRCDNRIRTLHHVGLALAPSSGARDKSPLSSSSGGDSLRRGLYQTQRYMAAAALLLMCYLSECGAPRRCHRLNADINERYVSAPFRMLPMSLSYRSSGLTAVKQWVDLFTCIRVYIRVHVYLTLPLSIALDLANSFSAKIQVFLPVERLCPVVNQSCRCFTMIQN